MPSDKEDQDIWDKAAEEENEDSFGEEVASGLPDIMPSGSQTFSPGGPNGIIRSQSFAGFSTLQERRSRCNSFIGNSSAVKKPQAKPKKMHNLGHKNYGATTKEPQPKRVEEVYGALKCGLNEYLEIQQTELDSLTAQLKDMRRNSRLGVLYDLDKQIKMAERYIRRLEFHISKVDELYEAFCIQRRLRDGACKMKQAFEMSPLTRKARESLAEINKNYKENTENMCVIEGELENLLGEFYIKMKGLAGFARLCPGDQYEIFMRYGRQRWKLKGKIEGNGKQSWDGEEIVFQPLVNELISIKVTELKGLATHLLVGSVTCETKDLFTARPQMVAVDINDLGTIKLNLEVTWYPFDTEDLTPSTGNLNKASAVQRRLSVYSQGTPETPTFEDRSFFSTLPDEVFENGTASGGRRPMSFSFSDIPNGDCTPHSSNSSPTVSTPSHPEITVTPPQNESEGSNQNLLSLKCQLDDIAKSVAKETDVNLELDLANNDDRSDQLVSSPCQQPSALKAEDVFLEATIPVSYLQETDEVSELKPVELDAYDGNITKQLVKRLTSTETLVTPEKVHSEGSISGESESSRSLLEGSLEEAFQGLALSMETHKEQYKELQVLDQEVMRLESLLKCRPAVNRSRSSSLSLTVESALESFDFLNTSDFDDDDGHDSGDDGVGIGGGADSVFSESDTEKISYTCGHPQAKGLLSEALTEDTGVGTSVAGSPLPLSTGNESLDIAIIKHLQHCNQLIQQLAAIGKCPIFPNSLHEKLSRQRHVLESLFKIISENSGSISSVLEAVPYLKEHQNLLSFWIECAGPANVYHTTVERVMKQLHDCYAETISEKSPGVAEAAFWAMVNQMMDRADVTSSFCFPQEVLTVFHFSVYLANQNITDLCHHLRKLANEVSLLQILRASKKDQVRVCLKELSATDLHPLHETLKALAFLLMENNKTSEAVQVFLSAASEDRHFKEMALIYYTEALRESNVHLQKSACMALKCLKATQSVKPLVYLCQSNNEELRQIAASTLLSLGEDGRAAYEQLNKAPQAMIKSTAHRGTAVTTAF
ncbi:rho family-interacting cell polarization regulator 2 isoform X2 [Protopterus annectens]|uniref:rho family-interacting cell polarization regulator 2 isoform X2 n=1 Tax=Protopterus annectens TaxID=7888 RepID=UPI001CFB9A25|nr:rho family-interacting cell polarization regulator 2 isoform X2 [Protopterus annectens]